MRAQLPFQTVAQWLGAPAYRWKSGPIFIAFLLLGLVIAPHLSLSQRLTDFQYVDSTSQILLNQHQYARLDSLGRAAITQGTDYPALRCRLGASSLETDHPAAALRHYQRALSANPLDTAARYGMTLAYLRLNQREAATLLARGLAAGTRQALHLPGFRLLTALEAEASGQTTTSTYRGNAGFLRMGLGTRLSPRLSLRQGISYFGQTVELAEEIKKKIHYTSYQSRQVEYQALLNVQLSSRWQAKLGYHYLNSSFGEDSYAGNLFYAALAYAQPYYTVQAGFYAGKPTDTTRYQADLKLIVYPLGNLRLYGFGRGSVVQSAGMAYPNLLLGAGGRLRPWLWVEAFGSTGLLPVLAEADGTYVYNLLDPLRRRAGANVLILLPHSLALRFSYTADQRQPTISTSTYAVYSLTTTLFWTW